MKQCFGAKIKKVRFFSKKFFGIVQKPCIYNRKKKLLKRCLTKRGIAAIIIHVVSARATTTAILENDIVKTRQTRTKFAKAAKVRAGARANKNSQISERDNGICQASSVKD